MIVSIIIHNSKIVIVLKSHRVETKLLLSSVNVLSMSHLHDEVTCLVIMITWHDDNMSIMSLPWWSWSMKSTWSHQSAWQWKERWLGSVLVDHHLHFNDLLNLIKLISRKKLFHHEAFVSRTVPLAEWIFDYHAIMTMIMMPPPVEILLPQSLRRCDASLHDQHRSRPLMS